MTIQSLYVLKMPEAGRLVVCGGSGDFLSVGILRVISVDLSWKRTSKTTSAFVPIVPTDQVQCDWRMGSRESFTGRTLDSRVLDLGDEVEGKASSNAEGPQRFSNLEKQRGEFESKMNKSITLRRLFILQY